MTRCMCDSIDIIAPLTTSASCILIIIRHVICQAKWKSADAAPARIEGEIAKGAPSSRRIPRRDDD